MSAAEDHIALTGKWTPENMDEFDFDEIDFQIYNQRPTKETIKMWAKKTPCCFNQLYMKEQRWLPRDLKKTGPTTFARKSIEGSIKLTVKSRDPLKINVTGPEFTCDMVKLEALYVPLAIPIPVSDAAVIKRDNGDDEHNKI